MPPWLFSAKFGKKTVGGNHLYKESQLSQYLNQKPTQGFRSTILRNTMLGAISMVDGTAANKRKEISS